MFKALILSKDTKFVDFYFADNRDFSYSLKIIIKTISAAEEKKTRQKKLCDLLQAKYSS